MNNLIAFIFEYDGKQYAIVQDENEISKKSARTELIEKLQKKYGEEYRSAKLKYLGVSTNVREDENGAYRIGIIHEIPFL